MMRPQLLGCVAIALAALPARTQTPVKLSLGSVRTSAEQAAVRLVVDISRQFSGADLQTNGNTRLLYFTPDIQLETGEADAFNGIVIRITGSALFFDTTRIEGILTPRTDFFHALPFSAGVETDRRFQNLSGLAEVGYVPWFQGRAPGLLKKTYLGVFVQGGYKKRVGGIDTVTAPAGAGSTDQSEETPNSGLARAKGSARATVDLPWKTQGLGFALDGTGDLWYDLVNSAAYSRVTGTFRIIVAKDRSFDIQFERGSGAPNFNKGDQISANLTVIF